jgi:ferritin-like metal-binding protein YciE
MSLGSLKDLYIDELGDLYDAETQMIRTLPRLAEAARAPELREALTRHCEESRLHLERLQLIFTHWGERQRSRPCAGLAGIVQEADDRLNEEATADARDAAIIGVARRIEHYEIAAYGCARTYARRLNRPDEARLLQETLDEEGRTERRLREIAEAHINDDARTESNLAEMPRPTGRLRFVGAGEGAKANGRRERLAVRSDADEELGTLCGIIVDSVSQQPRYAVIDSGGLFAHHRYLLPIDQTRFDDRARVLRVEISKEVASRYPPFDRDEFQTMTDSEVRGWEERIAELFPRGRGRTSGTRVPPEPPEWLLTGTWITLPPERAQSLDNSTRSFANEFVPDREQMIAREPQAPQPFNPKDVPTPPHGDKLRG